MDLPKREYQITTRSAGQIERSVQKTFAISPWAAIANMTSRGLTVAVYAVRLEASPPFAVSKGNQ